MFSKPQDWVDLDPGATAPPEKPTFSFFARKPAERKNTKDEIEAEAQGETKAQDEAETQDEPKAQDEAETQSEDEAQSDTQDEAKAQDNAEAESNETQSEEDDDDDAPLEYSSSADEEDLDASRTLADLTPEDLITKIIKLQAQNIRLKRLVEELRTYHTTDRGWISYFRHISTYNHNLHWTDILVSIALIHLFRSIITDVST